MLKKRIASLRKFWLKIGQERLFLLIVLLVAAASFLLVVERNFDGEAWDLGNSLLYAEEAKQNGIPLSRYLNEKFPQGNAATNIYEKNVIFLPLWQSLTYLGLKVFGSISFGVSFWLAIIGFSSIVVIYLIGKSIYDSRIGLFAALILASTQYYLVHVKSGFGYYSLIVLLVMLLFYLFIFAHQRKRKSILYLSGLVVFLILFNGLPIFGICAQALVLFLLLNFRYKNFLVSLLRPKTLWAKSIDGKGQSRLFGLRDYLIFLLIGFGLFFVGGVLYGRYFGASDFEVFNKIYIFWYSSRATWLTHKFFLDAEKLLPNLTLMAQSLFWKMPFKETDGYLTTLTTPGIPMFNPIIWALFIIGLIKQLKTRRMFDIFCIIWFVVQVLATTILAGFTARNWLFVAPCIALVAAVGLNTSLHFVKQKLNRRVRQLAFLVLILIFSASVLSGFYYYFFYFVRHESFLARASRQYEVTRAIGSIASPQDSVIVLDSFNPLPKDALHFFSSGAEYETYYYWNEIIHEINWDVDGEAVYSPKALSLWEQNILLRKKQIIYVFTEGNYSHFSKGKKMWGRSNILAFKTLHADLSPIKTIYYRNQVPATKIYLVDRTSLPMSRVDFGQHLNLSQYFWADQSGKVEYINSTGPAEGGQICVNEKECLSLFPLLRFGEELSLRKDSSEIRFAPLLEKREDELIWKGEGVKIDTQDGGVFITSTGEKSWVIFKIRNLTRINRLLAQTFPRLNNDPEGKNKVTMQISSNGKKYKTVYQVKSNKGNYWEWPFLKTSTHGIKVNSREIFIKFIFEGNPGESQLWSDPANQTYFVAIGESWPDQDLTIKKGLNKVTFEGEKNGFKTSLFSSSRVARVLALKTDSIDEEINSTVKTASGVFRLREKFEEGNNYQSLDFSLKDSNETEMNLLDFLKEKTTNSWLVTSASDIIPAESLVGPAGMAVKDNQAFTDESVYFDSTTVPKSIIFEQDFKLISGNYLAKLTIASAKFQPAEMGSLEVISGNNDQILARLPITGNAFREKDVFQELLLPFEVEQPEEIIKLRLNYRGEFSLWLDSVKLFLIKETIEGESLSRGSGSIVVEDPEASEGKAIFEALDVSTVGGHIFRSGPKLELEKGDYGVFYKMKVTDNRLKKSVINLDVVAQKFTYDAREIWGSDFVAVNNYQYFSLLMKDCDFKIPLEFRGVWFPKSSEIWLDKIDLGIMVADLQAEKMTNKGMMVTMLQAEEAESLYLRPSSILNQPVINGPIESQVGQKMRVVLRLKLDSGQSLVKVGNFSLFEGLKGKEIFSKDILSQDLSMNSYRFLVFDVSVDSQEPLRFEINPTGERNFWVDYIDFIPL